MRKLLIIIFLFVLICSISAKGKKADNHISVLIFDKNYKFVEYDSIEPTKSLYTSKDIKFIDGDTFILKKGNKKGKYELYGIDCPELYGIDCPELNQPYGIKAKTVASNFIYNKRFTISGVYTNEKKQLTAMIHIARTIKNGDNFIARVYERKTITTKIITNRKELLHIYTNQVLSGILLHKGLAWINPDSRAISPELKSIQAEAKKKKRGLWKDKNPIPPWEWKKEKESKIPFNQGLLLEQEANKQLRSGNKKRFIDLTYQAIKKYQQAVEENISEGHNVRAYLNIASAYKKITYHVKKNRILNLKKAKTIYEKILKIRPDDEWIKKDLEIINKELLK